MPTPAAISELSHQAQGLFYRLPKPVLYTLFTHLWQVCPAESHTELTVLFQMWTSVQAEPHAPPACATTLRVPSRAQPVRVGTG